MKVYIYKTFDHDYSNDDVLFEIDKAKMYQVFFFDNKYYIACVNNISKNIVLVEETEYNEQGKQNEYESMLTCPFCRYQNNDSWECDDSSDYYECGKCGSEFAYERDVEVTYSSKPIKCSPVIVIKVGKDG